MKLEYEKPVVIVEDYQIKEFVAGACRDNDKTVVSFHGESNYCSIVDDGMGVTFYGTYCKELTNGMDVNGPHPSDPNTTLCYHGVFNLFFQS